MLVVTVAAAALTGSAAGAASVTVNFPANGDSWCGTFDGVSTCGALSGGSTGKMQAANDLVVSAGSDRYPIPAHFVATGVSGTLGVGGASAYTVLDLFYPGSPYQIVLHDTVFPSPFPFPFSFTFATPTPLYPNSPFGVFLDQNIPQTNKTDGNWITIGTGTMTFTGSVPEPSTWAMMVLGFAALGFAGYRVSRKSVAVGA